MTDRTVLADALQGATVEMLMECAPLAEYWADRASRGYDIETDEDDAPKFRILAALALAVAEMQERSEHTATDYGETERTRPSEADEIEGTAADIVEHFDGVDVAALTDIERDAVTRALDALWFRATNLESQSCAADDRGEAIDVVDATIRKAEEARKAYDQAVRAAILAEVAAVVEEGREEHDAHNCDSCDCGRGCPTLANNAAIYWALTAIRALTEAR